MIRDPWRATPLGIITTTLGLTAVVGLAGWPRPTLYALAGLTAASVVIGGVWAVAGYWAKSGPAPSAVRTDPDARRCAGCGGTDCAQRPEMPDEKAVDHPRDRLCAAFIRLIRDHADRGVIAPGVMADTALDALQPELDTLAELRTVARGYCPACGRGDAAPTVTDWETERHRAEEAEAKVAALEAERDGWAEALSNLLLIDKPLAVIARIRQMVEAWERQLPDAIRTATAVDAIRLALDGPAPATEREA